jgi:hypothetical protein
MFSDAIPKVDAALFYSRKGWPVFPCHTWVDGRCTCDDPGCQSPAKHPLTPKGCKDASTCVKQVADWWNQTRGLANVAIATGDVAGLVVLDVDPKSGGLEALQGLERRHGPLPVTPTVKTGGGGKHFYFRHPANAKIGNRVGILPGIDLRGIGGYVIAPPSHHASGEQYAWLVSPEAPLAELPGWLFQLIQMPSPKTTDPVPAASSNGMVLKMAGPPADLITSPGVGEGERNATLCRLAGVHLARREDPAAVKARALAWVKRCSPPLHEAEVVRTVQSLAAKHQRNAANVDAPESADEVELTSLPEAPPWPSLDADAYYGPAGEIVRMLEPETEADPAALLVTLLVCFGNAVGRRPFFPVEGDKHHANLFAVPVGESSRGRKGTSLGRVLSLFEDADPDWTQNCIACGLSSGEGLIWAVRDPIEVMEPVKEKGKIVGYQAVVRDHGVTDKRLLVSETEFAQALRVLRREGNTLSPVIRQAWDKGSLKSLTKNNSAQATGAHVSLLGHITRPELAKYLDDTDCLNGFANRFLWPLVRRSKLLPEGGGLLDLQHLTQRLTATLAAASRIAAMSRSPEARALWHGVYPELTAERPGLYGAVTGRGEAQTLRLSMLYALLDGTPTIGVPHLRAALALWRYCEASARIIFGQGDGETGGPLEGLLLAAIRATPGINRKGLYKAAGGGVAAAALVQALARLRDRGLIRCEVVATGGRPSECWFPCEKTNQVALESGKDREQTSKAKGETLSSLARTPEATAPAPGDALSSFARNAPAVMTLAELCGAVNAVGGRLVRQADSCIVEAPAGTVTPEMGAALTAHRDELLALLPPPQPAPAPPKADATEALTHEQWQAEMEEIRRMGQGKA